MEYSVFHLEIWKGWFPFLSTKYLEKWSQSDFTDVKSGRAGGGSPCRMLFIAIDYEDCPNFLK